MPPREFCPDCGTPLDVEDGLLWCQSCDSYHGEADEDEEDEDG